MGLNASNDALRSRQIILGQRLGSRVRRFLRLAIAQIFDCALNHAFSPRQRRGIDLKLLLKHAEVYGDMMNPGCGLRQRGDKELQRVCPGGKANAVVCRRSCRNLGRERPYLS